MSDILTPRVDLVAVDEESTMQEVGALFVENGYSRLPIYHETIDNIIGVVHQKDFYKARVRGEDRLAMIKSPVVYTTPNTKIFKLLRILQMNKVHMAVVVDEYGGTEGIVTLEDILEELVGEIWDEHDEVTEFLHKQPDAATTLTAPPTLTICTISLRSRASAKHPRFLAGCWSRSTAFQSRAIIHRRRAGGHRHCCGQSPRHGDQCQAGAARESGI